MPEKNQPAPKVPQGLAAAHNEVKDKAPKALSGECPAGVEGGVAQLVSLKVGTYKADAKDPGIRGMPYLIGAAVVKLPTTLDGLPIEGLQTRLSPMPICAANKRTLKENWERATEVLKRIMGVEKLTGWGTTDVEVMAKLNAFCKALSDKKPHIRFRTWKGKKETTGPYAGLEPRTNHVWMGPCPAPSANGVSAAGAVNETYPEGGGEGSADASPDVYDPIEQPGGGGYTDEGGEPADVVDYESMPTGELAELANTGSEDASETLIARGIALGLAEADLRGNKVYKDWLQVGTVIEGLESAPAGEEPSSDDPWAESPPEKDQVFGYSPKDKGGKPGTKLGGKVLIVDGANRTVDLVNVKNSRLKYKNVAWDDLEDAP